MNDGAVTTPSIRANDADRSDEVVAKRVDVVHAPVHHHAIRRWSFRPLPLLDVYVLRSFSVGYLVCFTSLLALYVVVDFFTKSDEFATNTHGMRELVRHVSLYYAARLPWFFLRLSGVMALLAAVFALAWQERQNEVVAWLAAGVPARRLLAPVLGGTVAVIGLAIFNREFVVPIWSSELQRNADDPKGDKLRMVAGGYDGNMVLFADGAADPTRQLIADAHVTLPADGTGGLIHLHCMAIQHRPTNDRGDDNGWYLMGVSPPPQGLCHPHLDQLGPDLYFLHSDMTFEQLSRPPSWFYYESTATLFGLLDQRVGVHRRGELIVLLHRRLTTPLLDFLLVALGVLMLRVGQPGRNIYWKLGGCLILYAAFQVVQFTCQGLAQQEILDPLLAAWAPVFLFGPTTFAWMDALRN